MHFTLVTFLTDFVHLCDAEDIDFQEVLIDAYQTYRLELKETHICNESLSSFTYEDETTG